jgi:hypothetical protein
MSKYVRKTQDVYYLETDYGYGKELECPYDTYKEAKQGKKEYLENCPDLKYIRIVKKREEIIK